MTDQPYTTAPNRKGQEIAITEAKVAEWESTFGPWVRQEIPFAVQYIRDEMCDPKGKRYKNPVRMVGNWLRRHAQQRRQGVPPRAQPDPDLVKRQREAYWSPEAVERRERARREFQDMMERA